MPPSLLEGVSKTGPTGAFFPDCPRLDREVDALHQLARSGAIPADVAERQINTYLLAAGIPGAPAWLRRKLVLPITDGPHHSLLPDLGHVVHRILAKCPLPGSLSAALRLSAGDKVRYMILDGGEVRLVRSEPVARLAGLLKGKATRIVSLDEMDEAIAQAASSP